MTDVTADDIDKPVFTAEGNRIGTLREIDYPTIFIELADDIDDALRSDMKISETTARRADGTVLASATMASIESISDGEIFFWPAYASEARHEAVSYEEIPAEESHEDLHG